ncbi:MAG TPA: MFS transporter [Paracoccaceae bacterium]|nr:MFS transporter [Paracoccaceae bacterium]
MSSRAIPVLAAASLTQAAAAVGFWSFSLYAPELAAVTGLNERDFGLSVTFIFIGAFIGSPFTGAMVRRWGGAGAIVRLFAVMAGAMLLVLSGTWAGTMGAALLFGVGYAPQGPIGMTLVTQTAAPARRGLALSLRHAAVPLSAAIIGRVLPPLMLVVGWQAGVLSVTGVLLVALAFSALSAPLFRVEAAPPRHQSALGRFRNLLTVPPELRFLWGSGLAFALTQSAVTTFSYLYLLEVAHVSPLVGGIFVSNLHLTALLGRPALGWLTDRAGNPQAVLAGIAAVTVVTVLALLQVGPETPPWMLVPLAIGCGISGQCWNSVFVTAMSFRVEAGDLAELNGRAFAFLSLGWMSAPPLVWALIEVSGGYTVPMAGIAVLNVAVVAVLLAASGRERTA